MSPIDPKVLDVISPFAVVDGAVVPTEKATVSVLDRGLLRGEGVFETLRSYESVPFALSRHIARMRMSADATGIRLPDDQTLRDAVTAANNANELTNARFQLTVTGGSGGPAPDPIGRPEPTTIVIMSKIPPQPAVSSVSAVTLPWVRHEGAALTGVKPTSYLDHLVGYRWAHDNGADEGLWRNSANEFTEATGSNLFAVIGGVVVTPPPESGLLPGITRNLMIERCASRGITVEERPLTDDDIHTADECFLTSTTKEAVSIASIDGFTIGGGSRDFVDALLDDWEQWVVSNPDP